LIARRLLVFSATDDDATKAPGDDGLGDGAADNVEAEAGKPLSVRPDGSLAPVGVAGGGEHATAWATLLEPAGGGAGSRVPIEAGTSRSRIARATSAQAAGGAPDGNPLHEAADRDAEHKVPARAEVRDRMEILVGGAEPHSWGGCTPFKER
jgi:hypothetical protein